MKRNMFKGIIFLWILMMAQGLARPVFAVTDINEEGTEEEETLPVKTEAFSTNSQSPYLGAITIDTATGKVLFEDNADVKAYPASIIKLMNLLVILDAIRTKTISLDDKVTITAEMAKIGGSQVYLKQDEIFTVDELIYALMVQSANDAALALAKHLIGSKEAFVDLMNNKARELGMKNTVFHSVHGLPPSKKQNQVPDVSTPRDIAILSRELLKYPEVLKYTSVKERVFRPDSLKPFIMRNHNHLLGNFEGCDGLKTGYYRMAGFSIAATAAKNNLRVITVVMGSEKRKERDNKTQELMAKGLAELIREDLTAPKTPVAAPINPPSVIPPVPEKTLEAPPEKTAPSADSGVIQISKKTIKIIFVAILVLIFLFFARIIAKNRRRRRKW